MREKLIQRQIRVFNIVLIAMILIMMAVFVYAKDGLHPDEVMSFESANAYGNVGRLYDTLYSGDNVWVSKQDVRDAVTVGRADLFDFSTAMSYSYADFNPPLYRILLHLVSALKMGTISKWMGCSLNMLFLLGTLILLVRFSGDVLDRPKMAPYCIAIYGFSVGAITGVLIVKPHMMVSFSVFWTLYEHALFFTRNYKKRSSVRLFLSIVLGMLTQFYFTIFLLALISVYMLLCIFSEGKKEWKQYFLPAVLGVLTGGLLIVISDFLYNRDVHMAITLWQKLAEIDWRVSPFEFVLLYLKNVFGNEYLGFVFLAFFAAVGLSCLFMRKLRVDRNTFRLPALMLLPTFVYLLFPLASAACYSDRYLLSTFPILLVLMVWGIDEMLHLLPMKGMRRQWIISIGLCILVLPGIVFYNSEYLMSGSSAKEEIAADYEDFPSVFVGDDIYGNITEMMHFSYTMTATPEVLYRIKDDALLAKSEGIVLMTTENMPDFDIIDYLNRGYGYQNYDVLMESADGTKYYFLSK